MTTLTRKDVFFAIEQERDHQDKKWGTLDEHPYEVGSWLTIMRQLLNDAERAYMSQLGGIGWGVSEMNNQELTDRMRGFEIDHEPNGWPAIQMRDISAMCDAIESLLNALDVAEGEVKLTVAERDAALAELAK